MTRTVRDQPQRASAIRTFLIADIRGYTRFTNELGDEAGSRLAAKFAQVTAEGVEAYGGTLLELRGDEALCVFDSARSALRCAVELQDAFAHETRLEPNLPLAVGIGVDAGEAVPIGDGYRGAALNLASRLCSAADAGVVLATDGLVHLAGPVDGLSYTALDGKALKGFASPISAWTIAADSAHDHADEAPDAPGDRVLPAELDSLVPLVGRRAELRWLEWYWRRAWHGHGGAVGLGGPKGIGRTRLAAEVASAAHANGAVVRYVSGSRGIDPVIGPELLVVDDYEIQAPALTSALSELSEASDERRLVVITYRSPAAAQVAQQIGRLMPEERCRELAPLDTDGVREIAKLYLEHSTEELPAQLLLEESEGIPAAIHRVASQWARAAAARELGESARRTSRERRDLRSAEADLIGDVTRLESVRERSRLFMEVEQEATDVAVHPSTICPYKGLAAFEAEDTSYYFGRERLIAELIARMVGSAFIGIVGASGSGKTSAIQAGLLPALRSGVLPSSDQWVHVLMRPGDRPLHELRLALHRDLPSRPEREADPRASLDRALERLAPAQRLLLVVDQFEELFSTAIDEPERSDFVDFITASRPRVKILLAVRADHYERCAAYPRLAKLLGADQVLVGPPTPAEVASIIRHPAERSGLRVEPQLVGALVADIGDEPGALPLLSTALLELWEARDAGHLTLAAYNAAGGVRGAVARLAESAFGRLDAAQQGVARAILMRLAGEGEGGAVVRRRVRLDEFDLTAHAEMAAVLSHLTASRLLTTSDGYVEVAHEALLREWPRLRGWLDDEGAGRQLRQHLRGAAHAWSEGGREEGDLYRGARLVAVLDWSAEHALEVNATERAFLEASRTAADRAAQRQRRANRTLRGLLAGAAVLLVAAIGGGALAAFQAQRAEDQAQLARSRALAASALNVLESDPELAMQLALEAVELGGDGVPEAVTALHGATQRARSLVHIELPPPAGGVAPVRVGLAFNPSGSSAYVATDSYSVREYEVRSGRLVRTLGQPGENAPGAYLGIAQGPDGTLAMADADGVIHLWDPADGSETTMSGPGFGTPGRPAFSDDGTRLAVLTYADDDRNPLDLILSVWDVEQRSLLRTWDRDDIGDFVSIDFDPTGRRLLVPTCGCSYPGEVRWFDVETGDIEPILSDIALSAAVLSPDGATFATAGSDRTAKLWDAESGELLRTFRGHTDVVYDLTFSRDGSRLATTGSDDTTRVWDVESDGDVSGLELMTLSGQGGIGWYAEFSEDATRLATVSTNMTLRIWDTTRTRVAEIAGHEIGAERVMYLDQAGDSVVAYGRPCSDRFCFGEATVLEPEADSGGRITDQSGLAVALTPDGSGLFGQTGSPGDDATRWGPIGRIDLATLEMDLELEGLCPFSFAGDPECKFPPLSPWEEQVGRFAFSADGSLVAMVGNSGVLSLWNGAGESLAVVPIGWLDEEAEVALFGLALSPDGSLVAVATWQHGVKLIETAWLVEHGEELRVEEPDATLTDALRSRARTIAAVDDAWRLQFSPDGELLAIASPLGSKVVEVGSGSVRYELGEGWDLDVNAAGTQVVTLDTDGVVHLWEVATGRELQEIPAVNFGLGPFEGAVRFAPDERYIYVSDSGMVMKMTIDPSILVEVARSRLTRDLTDAECERYSLGEACSADDVLEEDSSGP